MYELIVVGGGAAAQSASVYALEKRLHALMIAAEASGKGGTKQQLTGQFVEEQLLGAQAVQLFQRELWLQPGRVLRDRVVTINTADEHFVLTTQGGGEYRARAVVVATGATPRLLDMPGAQRFANYGVGYSPTTHAPLVSGKSVLVVGLTVRAQRGILELARTASQVYVLPTTVGSNLSFFPLLRQLPNVTLLNDATLQEIVGSDRVEQVVLEQEGRPIHLNVEAVFADLGLEPNSELVAELVDTDSGGFICVDERNATSVRGLFAAGDVTTEFAEHVLVAIGEGARAANSAYEYLLTTLPLLAGVPSD